MSELAPDFNAGQTIKIMEQLFLLLFDVRSPPHFLIFTFKFIIEWNSKSSKSKSDFNTMNRIYEKCKIVEIDNRNKDQTRKSIYDVYTIKYFVFDIDIR